MQLKVVIVEPKYQVNLGYIARVSKNFGVKRLYLVHPRAKLKGSKAIMYAKHARELLEEAMIYKNFDEATKDCDIIVGTTGIWRKSKANFKRIFLLEQAIARIKRSGKKDSTVALVIGRDDIGLTPAEIEKCDMMAYIGTNESYPVPNISHALAIFLYAFTKNQFAIGEVDEKTAADRKELLYLFKTFDRLIEKKKIRDKRAVRNIFKRLVYNSRPSAQELHALITALK